MEIIIKYEFLCVPDDAQFDTEKLKRKIKSEVRDSIRIFDTDDVGHWSDDDEPEVLISKATTLITTDLNDNGTCQTDMSHIDQYRGIMFMCDSRYRLLSRPSIFKDKNGKFFQDGDVLEYEEHPENPLKQGKLLVCWDEDNACYSYIHESANGHKTPFAYHSKLKEDILMHCTKLGKLEEHHEWVELFKGN